MGQRMQAALSLYAFAAVGLFLLVSPWTPLWGRAMDAFVPASADWLLSGWLRGGVSGLGAVDLAVAAQVGLELWHGRQKKGGDGRRRPRST